MQRNARAETFAISSRRGSSSKALASPDGTDYGFDTKRDGSQLSDEEANNYNDGDLDCIEPRRSKTKRGSI